MSLAVVAEPQTESELAVALCVLEAAAGLAQREASRP